MKKKLSALVLLFSILYLTGCSDLQTDIVKPEGVNIHPVGFESSDSPNFHGKDIRNRKWDMDECKACHGKHFTGGTVGKSCVKCHIYPAGPEACNTCHGVFADAGKTSPPRDLKNNSNYSFVGVGAHTKHLYDNTFGQAVECKECHIVPKTLKSAGHIDDDSRAEIVWGDLAKKRVAGVDQNVLPEYDFATNTCNNVYCHGYMKNGNVENGVKWTEKIECGSCHGTSVTNNPLPGGTHPKSANCQNCHSKTITIVNNEYIINKNFHINGLIDFK